MLIIILGIIIYTKLKKVKIEKNRYALVGKEYVAGYMSGQLGSSGFSATTLANYDSKYYDVYSSSSTMTSYQYRILGDATGEMGPFKTYLDGDNNSRYHNSWYGDYSYFVDSTYPWFDRGGYYACGVLAGQFNFNRNTGGVNTNIGFRLVLSTKIYKIILHINKDKENIFIFYIINLRILF